MAQPRNIPQSKEVLLKSYNIRLKEDCKIMLENYFGEYFIAKFPFNIIFVCLMPMFNSLIFIRFFSSLEIIKLAKGENDSQLSKITQCEQDTYEMQVRAANIGKSPFNER